MCVPSQLKDLHDLWGQRQVAVVCNVGSLLEPTISTSYRNGTARVPLNLFSHADQQNQWQTSVANESSTVGWGGRTADKTTELNASALPVVLSAAGTPIFMTGNTAQALALAAAPTRLDAALPLDGFPTPPGRQCALSRYAGLTPDRAKSDARAGRKPSNQEGAGSPGSTQAGGRSSRAAVSIAATYKPWKPVGTSRQAYQRARDARDAPPNLFLRAGRL